MNNNERILTMKLCDYLKPDVEYLKEALSKYASESVLGQLFFNRMQSVAYGVMHENNLLDNVNREFRNSLKYAYIQNKQKNESFYKCVKMLSGILNGYKDKYAMLKGAVLCKKYPDGYRTSNDIDLLVRAEDVTTIGNVLIENGFRQGYIKNDAFIKATRTQIIESKIARGETVPYIIQVDYPYMKYLEVDINFSLDYKNNNNNDVDRLLKNSCDVDIEDFKIRTLQYDDFIIHLCGHLFKEATTLPWVNMKRDMTLYKFCDIYSSLNNMSFVDINNLFIRANEFGMSEICSCVIIWTAQLFENTNLYAYVYAKHLLSGREDILDTVISPKDKKVYLYTEKDIVNRFFNKNRVEILKEVHSATT